MHHPYIWCALDDLYDLEGPRSVVWFRRAFWWKNQLHLAESDRARSQYFLDCGDSL